MGQQYRREVLPTGQQKGAPVRTRGADEPIILPPQPSLGSLGRLPSRRIESREPISLSKARRAAILREMKG